MTSDRRIELLRLIEHAGSARYLMPGRNLALVPTVYDDDSELRHFLERLGGDRELLTAAYWLTQPRVAAFVLEELPRLLRRLGHGVRAGEPVVSSSPRGARWGSTTVGWATGSLRRGSFLRMPWERSADLPENRLLKLFLGRIDETCSAMAKGRGNLPDHFAKIQNAASLALLNPYLREVSTPSFFRSGDVAAVMARRDAGYKELGELATSYDQAIVDGKWAAVVNLLGQGWLAPIDTSELFELYGLLMLLNIVEAQLGFGRPVRYGLVQAGRSAVASFGSGPTRVDVYFDQTPGTVFRTESRYKDLAALHGLRVKERRPDVIIEAVVAGVLRRVLVEFKESDSETYVRDSVYKVFGYLHDFEQVWRDAPPIGPKAILIFPTGVKSKDDADLPHDVAIVSGDDLGGLARTLSACLGMPLVSEKGNQSAA